jgi:chorismate mutase
VNLRRRRLPPPADVAPPAAAPGEQAVTAPLEAQESELVDLERRRDQLTARVAELRWDLGGLVYEMATRDHIRVDVLVRRAALLQEADAELAKVERILRLEQTGTAGTCAACGPPHSSGAVYWWQCGRPLLAQVPSNAITAP